MRKVYMMLIATATAVMAISGCQKNDPFYTATEDDYPRILNSTFDTNGGANTFTSVYRDEPFTFTTIVTPALYTTVDWYFDGEKLATETPVPEGVEREGISVILPAGVYNVKLVATTTKGMETYRTGTLEVLARPEDPSLASDEKSRWLQIGTKANVAGSNLANVVKAYLRGDFQTKAVSLLKLDGFENGGSSLSFNVPEIAEGEYKLLLEASDGTLYGAGAFGVHSEEYVDPGVVVVETVLYTGPSDKLGWSAINIEDISAVKVGSVLRAYLTCDEGAQVGFATNGWMHLNDISKKWDAEGTDPWAVNNLDAGEQVIEWNVTSIDAMTEGGLSVCGNLAVVTKVVVLNEEAAPSEDVTELYTGPSDKLGWSAINIEDISAVKVGSVLKAYLTCDEGAQVGFATNGWMHLNDISKKWDAEGTDPWAVNNLGAGEQVIEWNVTSVDAMKEGGLSVCGNLAVVNKVVVINKVADNSPLFEGSADVHDWSKIFTLPEPDGGWGSVAPGTKMNIYATMIDHAEKYASFHLVGADWHEIQKDVAWGDKYGAGLADGSEQLLTLELSKEWLGLAVEHGGFAFQGMGFTVRKITLE